MHHKDSMWRKLTISRRYNQLPLLRSSPGGFEGSWPYRTYPFCFAGAKVHIFFEDAILETIFFARSFNFNRNTEGYIQYYF